MIMKNKAKLKNNATYKNMTIVPDNTKEQRITENNARIIANVFEDKLQMRGPRLVKKADAARPPQNNTGPQPDNHRPA